MMIDGLPNKINLKFYVRLQGIYENLGGICVTDDAWISSEAVGYHWRWRTQISSAMIPTLFRAQPISYKLVDKKQLYLII